MAITIHKIIQVQTEIDRLEKAFNELYSACLKERDRLVALKAKEPELKIFVDEHGFPFLCHFPAQTGAIKRASMDLTRALVKLRSSKD